MILENITGTSITFTTRDILIARGYRPCYGITHNPDVYHFTNGKFDLLLVASGRCPFMLFPTEVSFSSDSNESDDYDRYEARALHESKEWLTLVTEVGNLVCRMRFDDYFGLKVQKLTLQISKEALEDKIVLEGDNWFVKENDALNRWLRPHGVYIDGVGNSKALRGDLNDEDVVVFTLGVKKDPAVKLPFKPKSLIKPSKAAEPAEPTNSAEGADSSDDDIEDKTN